MLGQVLSGETRAIDAGGEFILVGGGPKVEVLEFGELAVGQVTVRLDFGKVHHGGGGRWG